MNVNYSEVLFDTNVQRRRLSRELPYESVRRRVKPSRPTRHCHTANETLRVTFGRLLRASTVMVDLDYDSGNSLDGFLLELRVPELSIPLVVRIRSVSSSCGGGGCAIFDNL